MVAFAGGGLAIQVAMNARLKDASGSPALASVVSFCVGLLAVGLVLLHSGAPITELRRAPAWAFVGGLFGAIFVTLAATASTKVGPALTLSTAIAGQVIGAMLLEHFGAMGVEQHPLTVTRIVGAVVLFVGVLLVQSK